MYQKCISVVAEVDCSEQEAEVPNRYKDVRRSILAPNHVRTRTWSYLAIPIISRLTLVDSQLLNTVEISQYGRL